MAKVSRPSLHTTLSTAKPTAAEIEQMAEKIHNAPPLSKKTLAVAVEETDDALLHRLTLDLPKPLLETIRAEAKRKRYTIKGFLLMLVDRYFDEQNKA